MRFPNEAAFQRAVIDLAKLLGCDVYHVPDSRHVTAAGFPDLCILGRSGVILRELKTERGRLRKEQLKWIDGLTRSGIDAAVWRPDDWPDRVRAEITAISRPRSAA